MAISEKLLHHIWKFKLLPSLHFTSINQEAIEILKVGEHNHNAGPDFFNGHIQFDGKIWVGNIEMHLKTSDWNKHKHQNDAAYKNVILHVVYENDLSIENQPLKNVPVVELKHLISDAIIHKHKDLIESKTEIACSKHLKNISEYTTSAWLQRLLIDRLENKLHDISAIYKFSNNNYQETFYQILAGNFGFKINKEPFILLARHTPLALLSKHKNNLTQIEAMLFGQSGMLADELNDPYFKTLQNEYQFLKHKYGLKPLDKSIWKLLRLRPANFPAVRIAQFAALIHQSDNLFSKILDIKSYQQAYQLFDVCASAYWFHHYTFSNERTQGQPKLGKDSVENICINTIAPLLFFYGREKSENNYELKALSLLENIPAEKNKITEEFNGYGLKVNNAMDSQALLQLYNNFCVPKKCLSCNIGHNILKQI
jgi:hypothetical protein